MRKMIIKNILKMAALCGLVFSLQLNGMETGNDSLFGLPDNLLQQCVLPECKGGTHLLVMQTCRRLSDLGCVEAKKNSLYGYLYRVVKNITPLLNCLNYRKLELQPSGEFVFKSAKKCIPVLEDYMRIPLMIKFITGKKTTEENAVFCFDRCINKQEAGEWCLDIVEEIEEAIEGTCRVCEKEVLEDQYFDPGSKEIKIGDHSGHLLTVSSHYNKFTCKFTCPLVDLPAYLGLRIDLGQERFWCINDIIKLLESVSFKT